jgi:long-chain acyl-CoA synthetase
LVPPWRIDGAIGFREALARGAKATFEPVDVAPQDLAFLQYTGGTTGVSKGAMLTHRNVLANVQQTSAWLAPCFEEGREIAIAPLPLYHIFCLTATLSFLKWGSLSVLVTNPRDLPALVGELGKWRWSIMTGVNTLFNALLNAKGFDRLDFSSVKAVIGGGAAVQRHVAERWHAITGQPVTEGYGLTEASPVACANPIGSPWNGTIGIPYPSTELSVRDDDFNALAPWTGSGDPAGHTGEICVRGPQVMKGYWNNGAETAQVLKDGWLRTGDIGYVDAKGWFTITDRKKDMILVSGFNVYPSEVESVIATLPGVVECGVVGVRDPASGEAVRAIVVRNDPAVTKEAVIAHCRTSLTGYKVPRDVQFRDAIPKSPIGKILRRALREDAPAP